MSVRSGEGRQVIAHSGCSVVALIPARGSSKGIPRKNLRIVAGKPLLIWTMDAVRSARSPIRCVVSTDDDEIADVARRFGAEVVRRPAELATDLSPTEPALLHALDALDAPELTEVMLLQATSPVRDAGTIDRALTKFRSGDIDSLVGVVPAHPFLWRGPTDDPVPMYDPTARPRRQDLTAAQLMYRESGSLYLTSVTALRQSRNRISGSTDLLVMAPHEGIDVDTDADLAEAERYLISRGGYTP